MVEMTRYDPGVPSWVDVTSRDMPATVAFYTALFGWGSMEPPGGGGYTMFLQRGKRVAGAGPATDPHVPEVWATFINVADAGTTVEAVKRAGGSVLVEPFDILTAGTMAVVVDDGGAVFNIWQPRDHIGAQIVNEPVSQAWNELASNDTEKSKAFYGAVFGWGAETETSGPMTYTEFTLAGRSIAGMAQIGGMQPAGTPPHWLAYFAVADTDATVARAAELGGRTVVPPMDIPIGRFAVVADARGAAFGLVHLAPH